MGETGGATGLDNTNANTIAGNTIIERLATQNKA